MAGNMLYVHLKAALLLFDLTLSDWAGSLEKPDGSIGVSHTAVTQIAKGNHDSPKWIRDEILDLINRARKEHPEFYEKPASLEVAKPA